jgi:hypothetical protein
MASMGCFTTVALSGGVNSSVVPPGLAGPLLRTFSRTVCSLPRSPLTSTANTSKSAYVSTCTSLHTSPPANVPLRSGPFAVAVVSRGPSPRSPPSGTTLFFAGPMSRAHACWRNEEYISVFATFSARAGRRTTACPGAMRTPGNSHTAREPFCAPG